MRSLRKPPTPKRLFRPVRPAPPAGPAVATWGREGGSILAVVARIGDARHVPPGYMTTDCSECGRGCWLHPQVQAMAERLSMRIISTCNRCIGPDDDGGG